MPEKCHSTSPASCNPIAEVPRITTAETKKRSFFLRDGYYMRLIYFSTRILFVFVPVAGAEQSRTKAQAIKCRSSARYIES